jgi:hypothetical protein
MTDLCGSFAQSLCTCLSPYWRRVGDGRGKSGRGGRSARGPERQCVPEAAGVSIQKREPWAVSREPNDAGVGGREDGSGGGEISEAGFTHAERGGPGVEGAEGVVGGARTPEDG